MRKIYIIAAITLAITVLAALFLGNNALSTGEVINTLFGNGTAASKLILFGVRLPRIAAAMLAGAALSVSGFLLQNSLNNSIASPGILGLNNGAGLFVLISAVVFPYRADIKCFMAFLGALIVTLFISIISKQTGMSKSSVILSGVAVSALCVSFIDIIISVKPETVADKTAFQLGGFASVQTSSVLFSAILILIVLGISIVFAPGMDIMRLGDDTAFGLGLNVKNYRRLYVILAALLSGAAISMCGLIGFVGLIVPNSIRLIYRKRSRGSLILCILFGSSFLLLCDTAARLLVFPYEIPCGLILSVLGAPFLIMILVKKRKRLGTDD